MKAPNFDGVASTYDAVVKLTYGRAVQKAQRHFLHHIPEGSRVLILGGGTGWILEELFAKANPAHVCFIDISKKMIAQAQKRLDGSLKEHASKVELRQATQESLGPDELFDVVITPFFLDLFSLDELAVIFKRLDAALLKDGCWILTDFFHAKNWFAPIASAMIWSMIRMFRLLTGLSADHLPDFRSTFEEYAYTLSEEAFFYNKMIRTAVYRK